MPARLGFSPLVWGCYGSPRSGDWFSVPLDQSQSAMPDPLVTNVQGHILSSLLWNFPGPSLCPTPLFLP